MNEYVLCVIIIVASELVAILLFSLLARWNRQEQRQNTINLKSILKGLAERAFLTFALLNGVPQALTVFAALKIATRIKSDHEVTNDFYLIGNIISITMAILYVQLIQYVS